MGVLIIIAGLAVAAVIYRISLRLWPFTRCGKCQGRGTNAGSNRKRFGQCRKCGGSGSKERLGTRLLLRRER